MDMRKINRMVEAVKSHLTDDLRKPQYRGHENCLAGHCYVASEALYHMLGGSEKGWTPHTIQHEGGPHWYLKHKHSGAILDPTANQFKTKVPYEKGRGCGFLTKQPSKRTQTVLNRIADGSSLAKIEDLEKNIGYVTYPKLNVPSPHTQPMESAGIPKREHLKNANAKVDSSRVNGAISYNARPTQATPEHARVMRGFVNLNTKTPLHAKRDHEAQHSVFSRIKQTHGKEFAAKLIDQTMSVLSPQERRIISHINPSAGAYNKASLPEETITHFHNYLQDPAHRAVVHRNLKLSPQGARNLDSMVKQIYQKMRLHAATLGPDLLGKTEIEDAPQKVACSIAVFNAEGHLLMGQRSDSKRWTLPGGKAEPGESPEACARRELKEETGLEVKKLKFLGKGVGGRHSDWTIYSYEAESNDKPTSENDPDEECDEWEWIDVRLGLPDDIKDQLNNGKNDVTLQLLGLQAGSANSGAELSKGLKHALIGAIAAANVAAPAGATEENHNQWHAGGLHEDLHPIATLESSGGKNIQHKPHPLGEFHTAVGAVGMKPATAHEEYGRSKWLQKVFPNLHDPAKFTHELKNNHAFYNHVATAHWQHLKATFAGDRARAAYAWRWGQGAASRDAPEVRAADPYAIAYQKLYEKAHVAKLSQHMVNPLTKAEADEWLAKQGHEVKAHKTGSIEFDHYSNLTGLKHLDPQPDVDGVSRLFVYHADTAPDQHVVDNAKVKYRCTLPAHAKLYDVGDDEHGLLTPKVRHTPHGTFYDAVDFNEVERHIKRMGYVGYHNYHPQNPNAVALFVRTPIKSAHATTAR